MMTPARTTFVSPEIARLRNLTTIEIGYGLWPTFDGYCLIPMPTPSAVADLVNKNGRHLREIRLSGDPLWTVHLPNLERLTLTEVQRPTALAPVLEVGRLTVLRLYVLEYALEQFVGVLSSAASTCPALLDLKLICESGSPMPTGMMHAVAKFVQSKKHLERLHVLYYGPCLVDDAPLVRVLKDLPAIRAVGFELARKRIRAEDLPLYDAAIP